VISSARELFLVVIGLISLMIFSSCQGDRAETSMMNDSIGVEHFMRDVDEYSGVVQVEGVVSNVQADDQLFTLIDVREFEKCGVTDCAPLSLPVRWDGPQPAVKDLVKVRGRVEEMDGKLVFAAAGLIMSQPPTDSTN